ncbi:adenosylmethionine decarboxylase [Aestuariispira ectoiniformans]|uniref:adenosylmethionine decarboxylase n=1 Tax=Aestuariispira ectoiniformans TaxID=2775080 RepID=UPI00223ACDC6|nr:adenosylmethionine decarboxylase [Aestuariispira ectoiniformans]
MPQDMSLIQLGTATGREQPSTNQTEENTTVIEFHPTNDQGDDRLDHFIEQDGVHYAGNHLIIDLWDASRLDEIDHIENTFRECIEEAGATLLHMHFHHFTPNGGVSGVAVLAESHISIHTWPECGYAALDIFMCGDAKPHKAIPVLKRAFGPKSVQLGDHKRGMMG